MCGGVRKRLRTTLVERGDEITSAPVDMRLDALDHVCIRIGVVERVSVAGPMLIERKCVDRGHHLRHDRCCSGEIHGVLSEVVEGIRVCKYRLAKIFFKRFFCIRKIGAKAICEFRVGLEAAR